MEVKGEVSGPAFDDPPGAPLAEELPEVLGIRPEELVEEQDAAEDHEPEEALAFKVKRNKEKNL